ncbi:hypothetical protein BDR07DRAFT_1493699 [Suillus spraguei]|nr:hypothetical protein BDR07DRAFT_1493699 [Suillus spraguei]
MITYHAAAQIIDMVFLDWVHPCLNNELQSNCSKGFVGFNDFNLYIPLASHLIYKFKTLILNEPVITLPFWHLLSHQMVLNDSSLLNMSPCTTSLTLRIPTSSNIGPTANLSFTTSGNTVTNPIILESPPPQFWEPSMREPQTPLRTMTIDVINLISPLHITTRALPRTVKAPNSPIIVSSPCHIRLKKCHHHSNKENELSGPIIELSDSDDPEIEVQPPAKQLKSSVKESTADRNISTIGHPIAVGSVFESIEEAQCCIYAHEANCGHCWC